MCWHLHLRACRSSGQHWRWGDITNLNENVLSFIATFQWKVIRDSFYPMLGSWYLEIPCWPKVRATRVQVSLSPWVMTKRIFMTKCKMARKWLLNLWVYSNPEVRRARCVKNFSEPEQWDCFKTIPIVQYNTSSKKFGHSSHTRSHGLSIKV